MNPCAVLLARLHILLMTGTGISSLAQPLARIGCRCTSTHDVTFLLAREKPRQTVSSMLRLLAVLYFSQGVSEEVAAFLAACPT